MKRLIIGLLFAFLPVSVSAQSVQDQIIAHLVAQGYSDFEVSYTLLRRLRIVARSPSGDRELVIDPATGVILRDTLLRTRTGSGSLRGSDSSSASGGSESSGGSSSGGGASSPAPSPGSGGGGAGSTDNDDDDDGDDDDNDDHNDDDDD